MSRRTRNSEAASIEQVTHTFRQALEAVRAGGLVAHAGRGRCALDPALGRMLTLVAENPFPGHQKLTPVAIGIAPGIDRAQGARPMIDVDHLRNGIEVIGGIAKRLTVVAPAPENIIELEKVR